MSWTTALVAGTQIAAGRQADAAGKFNQKIENRNAQFSFLEKAKKRSSSPTRTHIIKQRKLPQQQLRSS